MELWMLTHLQLCRIVQSWDVIVYLAPIAVRSLEGLRVQNKFIYFIPGLSKHVRPKGRIGDTTAVPRSVKLSPRFWTQLLQC